jgi:hypothetical protein
MIEAVRRIKQLERQVMWRLRWVALQDSMASSLLFTGLVSAAFVLYIRLKPIEFHWWIAVSAIFTVVTGVVLTRWLLARPTEREAAFAIDEILGLEDRITTARAIVERGGPVKDVEIALVEDAAARIGPAPAATVVPYRFSRRHALAIAAVLGIGLVLLVPQRDLTGARELASERAEIQGAGEQLEQASNAVEQIAPSGSETAKLAREQAELGRALRRSIDTRAEALRKLSTLGDRIRRRHDELASTRADEVVTLAERRLGTAAVEKPQQKTSQTPSPADELETSEPQTREPQEALSKASDAYVKPSDPNKDRARRAVSKDARKDQQIKETNRTEKISEDQQAASRDVGRVKGVQDGSKDESRIPALPDPSRKEAKAGEQPKTEDRGSNPEAKPTPTSPDDPPAAQREKLGDKRVTEKEPEHSSGITGAVAEQAAKALPGLSQQLLKRAAQLRAGDLKPEDIKQLQQAAQLLARDLAKVAQSKEFQRAVEELAKQVTPEQIEQVARELGNQEQLKRELEAAARLMMENQEVKQMVAGLAQEFAEQRDQFEREGGGDQGRRKAEALTELKSSGSGRDMSGHRRPTAGGKYERAFGGERLTAQGREEKLSGKPQRGAGGEYLYLQARPGTGASRSTYGSAYPQYRREAERSVERSQVPLRMRSVVRDYFDAINPDAKRKP